MAKKNKAVEVLPVEKWTTKEWEAAYNVLMQKYEKLREILRMALFHLNKAI